MTGWAAQLDRFEARLDEQRRALAEGRPQDVVAFAPEPTGPLPAHLVDRAHALSTQADAFTAELTAARTVAAKQLQVVTAMKGTQSPTSSYVDHRG